MGKHCDKRMREFENIYSLDPKYSELGWKWYVNALRSHGSIAGPFKTRKEAREWYNDSKQYQNDSH